jgi:topoisomerase-4 subunit A
MEVFKGPDFPPAAWWWTARDDRAAYETGKGAFPGARAVFDRAPNPDGSWEETGIEKLGGGSGSWSSPKSPTWCRRAS